jgi:hypothetical protein
MPSLANNGDHAASRLYPMKQFKGVKDSDELYKQSLRDYESYILLK